MKNHELIAMLSALPLEADVLVHVTTEDDDDGIGAPQSANAEFDCDDNEVIRLHCDGAFVESQPWPVWATRLEKFMRDRMGLNGDEGVCLDDVTDHIEQIEREAADAIEKFEVERKAHSSACVRIAVLEPSLTRARNMLSSVTGDIEDGYGLADLRGKYVVALMNARDDATDALRGRG